MWGFLFDQENMKNDKEFEMLLNEIPHATSFSLLQQQNNHRRQHQPLGHSVNGGTHGHGRVIYGSHGSSPTGRPFVQGYGNGIYGMYDDEPSSHHNKYQPVSPVNGFNLQSEGSSSSLGWFSSDDGSPRPSTLDELRPQTPFVNSHYFSRPDDSPLERNSSVQNLFNEMGRLNIRDEIDDLSMNGRFGRGLQFSDPSPLRSEYGNVDDNGVFNNCQNGLSDFRRLNCSYSMSPRSFKEEKGSPLLGLQGNHQMLDLSQPGVSPGQYGSLFSGHAQYLDPIDFRKQQTLEETLRHLQLQRDACLGGNYYDMGFQVPYTAHSVHSAATSGGFLYNQQNPAYPYSCEGIPNILASNMTQPRETTGMGSLMNFSPTMFNGSLPMFNGRADARTMESFAHSIPPGDISLKLEAFNCEDSIIIQGRGLHYVIKKRRGRSKEHRNEIGITHLKERSPEFADWSCSKGTSVVNGGNGTNRSMYSPLPLKHNSMMDIRDFIYIMAKDQHGCRFLQQTFDEGSPQDKQLIFQEIIDHVVELMMNPFGNYLVQKMLEKGNTDQRMKILLMVTSIPGELVRISLNAHGTRAVQKLINSLRTQEEKSVVISALEPGILDLVMDLNGNHVLQHCLQHLPKEENKFIFAAVTKYCCEIAMHRHGCCVLQRCISFATEVDQNILVSKVISNGLRLAQDAFGNYVIQFILELKLPSINSTLMSQFQGNYIVLSTQKFSSNVIEKCLKVFKEEERSVVINEFISSPQFENLLQDPYGNYVIQSALKVSKGPSNAALMEAIRPYAEILKNNPYFKRIFSWTSSKK